MRCYQINRIMKKTILTFAVIAVLGVSLSSCVGQKTRHAHLESSTPMEAMDETSKIAIDTAMIDAVKLIFAEGEIGDEIVMQKGDYARFAAFFSTAVYDTAWNDSGIMVKMVAPDYTGIISYKNKPSDDSDWLMVWSESGRTKFRQKWFFIAEDQREGLYSLLEKYRNADNGIEMNVWPERNGGVPQTLQLTVKNNTDNVIQFGANYSIECFAAGKWTEVDLGNFPVIMIMYNLPPGESGNYTINLFTDRVKYPEGEYRIVKLISDGQSDGQLSYGYFKIIEPR